uniref:Very long-chain fatty acid transport protein n=1 Tax=Strongyloides papillosus TaxID=174720 RepID=A0A0N5B621_STREA
MTSSCSKTGNDSYKTENSCCQINGLSKFAIISIFIAYGVNILNPDTGIFKTILIILFINILTSDIFWRVIKTLPRDIKGIITLITIKLKVYKAFKKNAPLHYYWMKSVRNHGNKEAIIDIEHEKTLTFNEVNNIANKYANFFLSKGFTKGSVVALYSENSYEFFAFWLGMSKIGVVTAWINSNLKLEPLAHSIISSKTVTIVTTNSLINTLQKVFDQKLLDKSDYQIYNLSSETINEGINLKDVCNNSTEIEEKYHPNFKDVLCYIYTSGTTGNPKPAVIKHFRYFFMSCGIKTAFGILQKDRMYITMPMYHSAAGILGTGQVIIGGSSLVIRKKFSASNFWKDAVKYNCTASQYIGEICRYLLAQKPIEEEKKHGIKLMFGNGLRGEIWPEFVKRFNVRKIGEFYGSTEGNSNIINLNSHVGACGFFPIYPFIKAFYPVRLLKVDDETGEIVRDKNGLCITCQPGETGEMCGVIKKSDPLLNFEGYVDKDDTSKKVIRDVMVKGDMVFTSGDLLYWDKLGYLYFKDRRGDTFRWKGENCSTMEVESILQPIMTVQDASVYGVEIPGKEGRAGMAGLTLVDGVNIPQFLKEVGEKLIESLPSYAVPVFLRICKEVEQTGTFKLKKTELKKEGFDLEKCNGDPIYYMDWSTKSYTLLTPEMQKNIETGKYSKL